MRCKTCGSQLGDNAEFCPNCGITIHHSAESEVPVNMGVPQEAGYMRQVKVSQERLPAVQARAERPVRGRAGLRAMYSLTVVLLLLVCGLGTVFLNILRLHYEKTPEKVYTGIYYSMGFRSLLDMGAGDFFDSQDTLSNIAFVTVFVMLTAVVAIAVTGAVSAFRRKFSKAAKLMGIGFVCPLISYIISFIDAIYIRSTYLDDGFSSDKCHLGAAPLIMMIFCSAAVFISFLAADSMDKKK